MPFPRKFRGFALEVLDIRSKMEEGVEGAREGIHVFDMCSVTGRHDVWKS